MGLFDTRRAKVSLACLVVGGFVFALLVILGVFVKTALHKAMTERLEYKFPPGYSKNKDLQWCYLREDGEGKFNDEYYMWNLTNVDEVVNGGNAVYNLVGPYVFANWTCRFNWKVADDVLSYNELSYGYHFLASQSAGSQYDKITNVNPGYLGLMKATGSEGAVLTLMVGGALNTLITTLQAPATIQQIQGFGTPTVLATINGQVATSFAAGVSLGVMNNVITAITASTNDITLTYAALFNDPSTIVPAAMNFQGFAYFVNNTIKAPSVGPLSNSSISLLIADWSAGGNGGGLIVFAKTFQASPASIVTKYSITSDQAAKLYAYVGGYLMNPQSLNYTMVMGMVYSQWANLAVTGSRIDLNPGQGLYGWEVGWPTPTGITPDVVAKLFDPTNQLSFTNINGTQAWLGYVQNKFPLATLQAVYPTLTTAQINTLAGWYAVFFTNVVPPLMQAKFGITTWNDFAYAQWGQMVLGQSVGVLQNLAYMPEIAAFDPTPYGKDPSCVRYTIEEAKYVLNGTNGIMSPQNSAFFFAIAGAKNYNATRSLWGLDPNKTDCLLLYLTNVLRNKAVMPVLNASVHAGSGLFVTRTVNEWLFNAKDPLLGLLGQPNSVAVVGNVTRSYEDALYNFPPQKLRIYTGKNDLFWSLQVPNADEPVHGFWAADLNVTGFNGTQWMPYDWVKKASSAKDLHVWHPKVMRPVGLKYYGMTDFGGLKTAYLSFAPETLASSATYPANSFYFSTYSGLINQSHFPTTKGLPLFISLPNFNSAEPAVTQNLTMIDNVFSPIDANPIESKSRHRHQPFLLVEPYTGQTVWANLPIQGNFQYGPTDIFFPKVKPNFAPIFWSAVGDKGKQSDINTAKKMLYGARMIWKSLIGIGAGLGGILMILGTIGLMRNKNQYKKAKAEEKSQNDKL